MMGVGDMDPPQLFLYSYCTESQKGYRHKCLTERKYPCQKSCPQILAALVLEAQSYQLEALSVLTHQSMAN